MAAGGSRGATRRSRGRDEWTRRRGTRSAHRLEESMEIGEEAGPGSEGTGGGTGASSAGGAGLPAGRRAQREGREMLQVESMADEDEVGGQVSVSCLRGLTDDMAELLMQTARAS
eukprot:138377-Hanusia_phi.AAC.1